MKRMLGNAAPAAKGKGKKKAEVDDNDDAEPLKLVYVTPERIEKSKTFVNTLQKCYDAGLLSRFVIDEAHCLSSMGHDYRPGYLSLQRLRVLFPKVGPRLAAPSLSRLTPPLSQVPILAVTATAPQNVVADMLKILGLSPRISPGHAALPQTTVLFSAPLYRPNLRYSVVPKPANAQVALEAMIDWVLEYHPGESGILYTLSRAECEKISQAINGHPRTKGKMRAAVCASSRQKVTLLADVLTTKARRPRLHRRRREAARARSLALGPHHHGRRDERLVRTWHRQGRRALRPAWFVTQEPRQSLPGEREAGRDGLPADCITFFRAADASRLSTLTYDTFSSGGKEKRAFRPLRHHRPDPSSRAASKQSTRSSALPRTRRRAARCSLRATSSRHTTPGRPSTRAMRMVTLRAGTATMCVARAFPCPGLS